MSSRDAILSRIRRALDDRPNESAIRRGYHQAAALTCADLPALLVDRLRGYGASVRRCTNGGVRAAITAALAERGVRSVVAPDGVPTEWLPDAVRDSPPLSARELDRLDAVLTTCALAIAQTGTIVLDHESGQGRRVLSLVVDYHLVVVRAEQIVHTVPDAVAALDPRRTMTWISGPSATSDIELSRVEGVHGPRHLEIIITSPDE